MKKLLQNDVNPAVWAKFLQLCEIHKLQDNELTHLELIEIEGYPCAAKFKLTGRLKEDDFVQPIKEDGTLYPIQGIEEKIVFKR